MIFALTVLSLIAFAANSILCRIALGQGYIDPAGFTIIRLLSGSIALYFILIFHQYSKKADANGSSQDNNDNSSTSKGSWLGSALLFSYALSFSYAYGYLDTGTGALILFGSVQICLILSALIAKQKLLLSEWLGLGLACIGFVYLIYPELTTPSLVGFVLMMVSGVAWAGYTLIGKRSKAPLIDTCYNFFRTIPFVLILLLLTISTTEYSYDGILLAVLSGAIMSGVGYAIWYTALTGLTTTKAAVVQLLVPVIATIGGVIFMSEAMTTRLQISTLMVLGGIALVLLSKQFLSKSKQA
ncbi:DMT family transporter [Pseudocolwellia sp. HL-MZ19]|uniref:DMT family transporter n=1 Tax=unclassified Pseudocolwellia TaxID=2848178 RepID=UPI003CF8E5AC